ncbi:hypothetical protein [Paenibacillus sp. NPDC055715]
MSAAKCLHCGQAGIGATSKNQIPATSETSENTDKGQDTASSPTNSSEHAGSNHGNNSTAQTSPQTGRTVADSK